MIPLLITGGLGFVGSNYINYIYGLKIYKIICLDNETNCLKEENVINPEIRKSSDYEFIKGNFGDERLVKNILNKYKIRYVLNLAITSFQPETLGEPVYYVNNNVLNTTKFLQTCVEYGKIEKFIHMSTFLIYNVTNSLEEESKMCINEYSTSKTCSHEIIILYRDVYKLPIMIGMGNAFFGKTQCPFAPVPDYLTFLKNGNKIPVQTKSTRVFNYVYIDNVVTAIQIMFEKGEKGKIYNILDKKHGCYDDDKLAKTLVRYYYETKKYKKWIKYIDDKPCKFTECPEDNEELRKLGWKITTNVKKGLKIVADYYK